MAGGKLNARQKMINMMYLVLTALLALNVAKEVLNAFVVINMGLLQQKASMDEKNSSILNEFTNQRMIDSSNKRLNFLNEQAIYMKGISDELSNDIEKMKIDLVVKVDKVDESKAKDVVANPIKVDRKDDYDGPTRYFGTDNAPGTKGTAHDLKLKINAYREKCLTVVDKVLLGRDHKEDIKREISKKLAILLTEDPKDNEEYPTWEMQYFYHLPLVAALTELTKWENFVKGAEGDMLNFLWNDISANTFKFDAIKVAVIPKSSFVTSGSNFEADVFLAAYSTNGSNIPTIVYGSGIDTSTMQVSNGVTLQKDKFVNGVGEVSFPVSGSGEKTFAGTLQLKDPSGNLKTYPFNTKYSVAPPSASIAPTQLDVVYYGVDNPFSIAVPGVAPNNILVTTSGASLRGGNGSYVINPTTGSGKIKVNVSARMEDGTTRSMGTKEFRVKKVPNPEILICKQKTNTSISRSKLLNNPIVPDMSDFLFPVYATVISVKGAIKTTTYKDFSFNGNVFSDEVKGYIKAAPNNSKIYLDEIKVSVPGGTRTMSAVYTITN